MDAVREENLMAVHILLENGSDPNITSYGNYTALYIAFRRKKNKFILKLLQSGANPNNGYNFLLTEYDNLVFAYLNPWIYKSQDHNYIINKRISRIDLLLRYGADPTKENEFGRSSISSDFWCLILKKIRIFQRKYIIVIRQKLSKNFLK